MREVSEEEQLSQEVVRGNQARAVLDNPEFRRAFIEYQAELFDSLKKSKWDAPEKREEIYRQCKALDTIEAKLTVSLQTGTMAVKQLSLMQKAANGLKNVIG